MSPLAVKVESTYAPMEMDCEVLKQLSYPAVWFSSCLPLILERTAQSLPFLKGCANQHNLLYATGQVV